MVHAGLYYAPGSLKATLCREGKAALEAYAEAHGIPIRYPGKLVVALTEDELPRLADIRDRATANGVDGLEEVGPERIRELEPKAAGIRGLWSPRTGIVDFRAVALAFADDLRAAGAVIHTSREVTAIRERARRGRPDDDHRRPRGGPCHRLRRAPRRPRGGDDRGRRPRRPADRAVPRRLLHALARTPARS